jgi:hypothetical protein
VSAIDRSCDSVVLRSVCIDIVALPLRIPGVPTPEIGYADGVSLSVCKKILRKYLKFGHYHFLFRSPVLGQQEKLPEAHFRKNLAKSRH